MRRTVGGAARLIRKSTGPESTRCSATAPVAIQDR